MKAKIISIVGFMALFIIILSVLWKKSQSRDISEKIFSVLVLSTNKESKEFRINISLDNETILSADTKSHPTLDPFSTSDDDRSLVFYSVVLNISANQLNKHKYIKFSIKGYDGVMDLDISKIRDNNYRKVGVFLNFEGDAVSWLAASNKENGDRLLLGSDRGN